MDRPVHVTLLAASCLAAILVSSCGSAPTPAARSVRYENITRDTGLDFEHFNGALGDYYYVETFGAGAAFFDYDDDGWLDVYLVNGAHLSGLAPDPAPVNRLFRSERSVRFENVTDASGTGDRGYGMGCAVADYDNDGDEDLYVTNFGPNVLFRNDRDEQFADVTRAAHVGDDRWGSSAAFLDYDLDGDVDLFVANYVEFRLAANEICKRGYIRTYCEPQNYEPIADILYRNDGASGFADVSAETGITLAGRGLGVALSDYDRDGDTDIYVANDATMNFLYENRRGHFVEVGLPVGGRYNQYGQEEAGMGVDFGDFDNDGHQDLFVTNFARESNTLYRNKGGGRLLDVTDALGLTEPSYRPLGFGAKFMDFDNDGFLDLFVTNGHVLDIIGLLDSTDSYPQADQMLRNEGGERFVDVSAELGNDFIARGVGRGAAAADYDNDGDLDLLVTEEAGRARLLRNGGGNSQGHWLLVELEGSQHGDALGTRVTVTSGDVRQVRERQSGSSYLSSHDPRLHFGLGTATIVDLEVRWPAGAVQTFSGVAADQILQLRQPPL